MMTSRDGALNLHLRPVRPVLKVHGLGLPAPAQRGPCLPLHGQAVQRAGVSTGPGVAEVLDGGLAGSLGTRTSGKYGPTKRRSSWMSTEPHESQRPPQLISLHSGP